MIVTVGAARDDRPAAQQLLDAAHKASDLSVLGPYVFTGQFVVDPGGKKELKGRLTIYRDGDRERADLEIGGAKDSRLTLGRKSYYDPQRLLVAVTRIAQLDRTVDPKWAGLPGMFPTNYKFGDVKPGKVHESPAWCVERTNGARKSRLCFDAVRGVLLSEDSDKKTPTSWWRMAGGAEFLDFAASGAALFPRKILLREQYVLPIEVSQIEVTAKELDPDIFAIPERAMEFETCDKMEPPKATYTPEPDYPALARHNDVIRTIGLNAVITKTGDVGAVLLLTPTGDGFDRNAVDGVKKWRFRPGSCEGHPVNVQIDVEIEFHMQ